MTDEAMTDEVTDPDDKTNPVPDDRSRIDERSDGSDLVGTAVVKDKDGNPVPIFDDDGNEMLGVVPPR